MGCCGRPDPPAPVPPPPPPRAMNFAFDLNETVIKHPAEFFTIMECLRRGGHKVILMTLNGVLPPADLGFDFSHFERVSHAGYEDSKLGVCREHKAMLFEDGSFRFP